MLCSHLFLAAEILCLCLLLSIAAGLHLLFRDFLRRLRFRTRLFCKLLILTFTRTLLFFKRFCGFRELVFIRVLATSCRLVSLLLCLALFRL